MKPVLHFAHANGIPSATYQKMLHALSDQYDVVTLPLIGTDPKFPVNNHWSNLVDQLIDSVEKQGRQRSVIALGHSLGALLSFMAAYKRPELFSMVIMLDPPLINGRHSLMLHMAKLLHKPTVDKVTPAGLSAKRRDHWDSRVEAAEKLRGRGFFAHFDSDCFDAYIRHGLSDAPTGGVTLTIPKAVEVSIFRNNPSWFWLTPRSAPEVPAHLVVGQDSQFYQRGFPQRVQRQLGIPFSLSKGGHMFPLERPLETAQLVKQLIRQIDAVAK